MITVIKKIIIKKKEQKRQGKKNACPTRLEPGTFTPTLRFYHEATRALSPDAAKSLNLNKTDVVIMQHIFKET